MLRPYVRRDLDPEQVRRLPFREPFEPLAAPEQRSLGELVHEPVAHAELACQVLDVALRGEEAVRTTLDDEAVPALRDDHATGAPPGLQHDHVDSALLELPCGDRKSTRLNSSHGYISYAVFCL